MLPENLNPIGERVLVEIDQEDEKVTSTGIIILNVKKNESSLTGKVLAIGEGIRTKDGVLIPMTVKVGDIILFPKESVKEVTLNNKKYAVVKESEVLGIV